MSLKFISRNVYFWYCVNANTRYHQRIRYELSISIGMRPMLSASKIRSYSLKKLYENGSAKLKQPRIEDELYIFRIVSRHEEVTAESGVVIMWGVGFDDRCKTCLLVGIWRRRTAVEVCKNARCTGKRDWKNLWVAVRQSDTATLICI